MNSSVRIWSCDILQVWISFQIFQKDGPVLNQFAVTRGSEVDYNLPDRQLILTDSNEAAEY